MAELTVYSTHSTTAHRTVERSMVPIGRPFIPPVVAPIIQAMKLEDTTISMYLSSMAGSNDGDEVNQQGDPIHVKTGIWPIVGSKQITSLSLVSAIYIPSPTDDPNAVPPITDDQFTVSSTSVTDGNIDLRITIVAYGYNDNYYTGGTAQYRCTFNINGVALSAVLTIELVYGGS